ncbi:MULTISPECIES: DNA adenine methylase [unclassified Frondihabitans]|uniref:DNA adenine methylase n=1 Tax=unclassified Frondihabitans TaxID=2626248 RepID=UPI000F4E6E1E|nr:MULTISPECIES: DNA adenine methylase [unclassified Frondihabitans]RPE77874.1 DNA adenine methylase [Frondihabitans sp. PhB153]RPF08153.1 DNA adenine methylase [Frondihabitans sp. PhB161]
MPVTPSPLRYPGGKTSLQGLTTQILTDNSLRRGTYAEPFAGGAGLALSLLFRGDVRRLVLNDLDPAIWAFWNAVLTETEAFARMIEAADISMSTWQMHRDVITHQDDVSPVDLAFSTLFLNRTNRSGVILGGVIGGKDQTGPYKLDCRFNRDDLAAKVRRIGRYRTSIDLHRKDGRQFLTDIDAACDGVFFFIDPPYFHKGSGLYANSLEYKDHEMLAATVTGLRNPWVLTYDWTPEIRDLYGDFDHHQFDINYSASVKRVGQELLVGSRGLHVRHALEGRGFDRDDKAQRRLARAAAS